MHSLQFLHCLCCLSLFQCLCCLDVSWICCFQSVSSALLLLRPFHTNPQSCRRKLTRISFKIPIFTPSISVPLSSKNKQSCILKKAELCDGDRYLALCSGHGGSNNQQDLRDAWLWTVWLQYRVGEM